jgi:hypothetical protein
MAVFLIVATKGHKTLEAKLETTLPDAFYPVRDDAWLVEYDGTTQQVADALGIRSGEVGAGLVVPVVNYSGRGSMDMWEWLQLHLNRETA